MKVKSNRIELFVLSYYHANALIGEIPHQGTLQKGMNVWMDDRGGKNKQNR